MFSTICVLNVDLVTIGRISVTEKLLAADLSKPLTTDRETEHLHILRPKEAIR